MKWLVLLSLIAANVIQQPSPVVKTKSGLVRGRVSENGRFYQYFGIPYATVEEENRFQAPLPPPRWKGIFEAADENTYCVQINMGKLVVGDVDCLKLNVYTPTGAKPGELLPVMVYIHGGCFYFGSGSPLIYGGDFLVEQGVVFVSINYRLGVEGFLCLGIKEAPGNAGLRDQIAALKWVQGNIQAFGGDPNNVTLFGESAGAVSTSFQILSPAARGLFHRVILQSGSTLAPWGLQHQPIETASNLVKKMGFDTKDPYEMFNIISNKTAIEIVKAMTFSRVGYCITADILFSPCIEKEIPGVEPIITQHPTEVIKSGNYTKLPMIIGHNDREGLMFVSSDYGTSLKEWDRSSVNFLLKSDLEFSNEQEKNSTAQNVVQHYFSSEKDDQVMDMVDLYSDLYFKFPSVIEAELYSKTNDAPMYYYLFKYSGYVNVMKTLFFFGNEEGASHADELFYMFRPNILPMLHHLEKPMIERMVSMWTSFAKYSDPTPKTSPLLPVRWRPSREPNPIALVIDHQLSLAPLWDPASVALWNTTYNKFRRKSYGFKNDSLTILDKAVDVRDNKVLDEERLTNVSQKLTVIDLGRIVNATGVCH